ncbi:MAG TPA: hypothetical protein VF212_03880 [Longimicrobiales bacterium]
MRMSTRSAIFGAVLAGAALLPADGLAQRGRRSDDADYPDARYTVEIFGGLADYGRFLEQFAGDFGLSEQREVTASTALALGASVGMFPWEKTGVRLAFTWSPTDLEFQDDSGLDIDALDEDDIADLTASVLSLDVIRFLLDPSERFTPYASGGITATWWSLDDENGEILSEDDTQFRWGGYGAIGLQYRATRKFGVRLEVATMGLGNPFDGKDSYRTATGITFDEPSTVRLTRIALALTYSFLRD